MQVFTVISLLVNKFIHQQNIGEPEGTQNAAASQIPFPLCATCLISFRQTKLNMELAELQQRLKRLDSDKLIDVVKNYRQYGYSTEIRNYAISLLEDRGISHNDLLLTGNFENKSYDFANTLLSSFNRNSKLAFFFYGLLLILKVISIWFNRETSFTSTTLVAGYILASLLYIVFLVQSFLNQSDFYKATGDEFGSDGALAYLLLGMPFYFVMYFVFQNQMKERMETVH